MPRLSTVAAVAHDRTPCKSILDVNFPYRYKLYSFSKLKLWSQGSSAKMDSNTTATITLAGFLAALVHLSHARAVAAVIPGGGPNTAAYTQLSYKLESLLHQCLQPNIFPDIARRVSILVLSQGLDSWSQ